MWPVSAVMTSLIAVAGTLLGSFSTYLFQRRTALRAEAATRSERLRQEQLAACGGFAAAITELKRAVIATWFKRDQDVAELHAMLGESDRFGAAAEAAKFRMLLVTDDDEVRRRADSAFAGVGRIGKAGGLVELKEREREFEAAVLEFVAGAGRLLKRT